jgi:hypothetical protein
MIANEWTVAGAIALAISAAVIVWRVREFVVVARSARVEAYLRLEKEAGIDKGQRSARHLMAKLGLTEGQVLEASRRSPAIKRLALTASLPNSIFADSAMFEYAPLGAQGRNSI